MEPCAEEDCEDLVPRFKRSLHSELDENVECYIHPIGSSCFAIQLAEEDIYVYSSLSPNFGRSVFGCTEADCSDRGLICSYSVSTAHLKALAEIYRNSVDRHHSESS